jgi:hypothetical protein
MAAVKGRAVPAVSWSSVIMTDDIDSGRLDTRAAHADPPRVQDRARLVLFWVWMVLIFGGLAVMVTLPLAGR